MIEHISQDAQLQKLISAMKNAESYGIEYNKKMLEEKERIEKERIEKIKSEITNLQKRLVDINLIELIEIPKKNIYISGYSGQGKSALLRIIQLLISKELKIESYFIDESELFHEFRSYDFDLSEYFRKEVLNKEFVFLDDFFKETNWKFNFNDDKSKRKYDRMTDFIELLYKNMDKFKIIMTSNNKLEELDKQTKAGEKAIFGFDEFRTHRRLKDIFKIKLWEL